MILTALVSTLAKIVGFVRLQQTAATLGLSYHADVLLLAVQLIWLLEITLITSAVIPVIVSRIYDIDKSDGSEVAAQFLVSILSVCLAATFLFGLGLFFFSDLIVKWLAPAFEPQARILFQEIAFFSILTPMLLGLAHFLGLMNRLCDNGVWYSVPQIITNAAAVAGLLWGFQTNGLAGGSIGLVLGTAFGAILVSIMQVWVLPRRILKHLWHAITQFRGQILAFRDARVFWTSVGALLLAALLQEAYIYIDFFFASRAGSGSIAAMGYASRLATLVNMLLVSSAFVILEPRWARALSTDKTQAWQDVLLPDAKSLISLTAAPAAVLFFAAADVTSFIYRSHTFPLQDQILLNRLTQVYSMSVIALGVSLIITRMLVLAHETRWVVRINLCAIPIKLALAAVLFGQFDLAGLAASTVMILLFQATIGLVVLQKTSIMPHLGWGTFFKLAANTTIVFAAAYLLAPYFIGTFWGMLIYAIIMMVINIGCGMLLRFSYTDFLINRRSRV